MTAHPFRTSTTARLLSAAAAIALIGGGLAATAGSILAMVLALVTAILVGLVGLVLGAEHHGEEVLLVGVVVPMALLPYAMLLVMLVDRRSPAGWALVAGGLAMLAQTALASLVRDRAPASAAPARVAAHH
jgi:hypothetical protein